MEFVMGGAAASGAALFTNPLEVVKTRIQLQGELQARGRYPVHYKNVAHALFTIVRHDGFRAVQSGLGPALCYQFCQNGFRLGVFHVLEDLQLTKNDNGEVSLSRSVLAGAVAGSGGAFVASPLYMIKTQLQSKSQNTVIAVGFQHRHGGMLAALSAVWAAGGLKGLWRGASAATIRVSMGSSVQLGTFSKAKSVIVKHFPTMRDRTMLCTFFSSVLSGTAVCIVMTPFDVVCTRLYNQGLDPHTSKGLYYNGFLDCFSKILHSEGPLGFYKGISAAFLRCGPHTVISLTLWQILRDLDLASRTSRPPVVSLSPSAKLSG
ncbi:solute carrier family 25 member 35-like [Tropilaelaps mercedesae]|uniref:Solute carrier family 25 member 35-like n=1 Tax=Tropilaelaps mercedesae TaxID=418985 RepID=A0A1V9XAI5_9ACAR|nr:solute carrier family 25 member 35-like [Tropilaelaps mercedesae]